jgi:methionyl-tRNA formyltransferase
MSSPPSPPLRLLFLGTPEFAVPSLESLLASHHHVVGVVTQPDRPRGRGQQVQPPPVKKAALRAGVPCWQPERLRAPGFFDEMRALAPDLGVVAAYGKILPGEFLAIPRLGMINVHASLLPRWRGASPIQHAVMAGDSITGVTIMRMVEALDAGAAILAGPRAISSRDTAADVERDLSVIGADLLIRAVDQLSRGETVETPQDEGLVTLAPRLKKEDGEIDWRRPALELDRFVRGLHPWPLARTTLSGETLIVLRAVPLVGRFEDEPAPGTIVEARGDRLVAACGGGSRLQLMDVQPQGRRAMAARDFLAGHRLTPGVGLGPAGP